MNVNRHFASFIIAAACATGTWAAIPQGYYDDCENRGGQSLLTALNATIGSHTTVSYSGLWNLYKTSDVKANGKIWDMYSTKEWNPGKEQCGQYSSIGDCYNREHSFPKSWFNDASPMVSDAFHIYPTDGKVNGQRSNYPYGECANGTRVSSSGGVQALGKLGRSTFEGYSGTVFEPDDQYKGDFARSYFYMAACYNTRISSWSSDMLAGNNFPCFKPWAIKLLLKWHRMDPVSQKEIDRNNVVYNHQRNRNPFIDHPEMVEYIWGDRADQRWTSTGSAAKPEINRPVDGSTIDLGLTATGIETSRKINIRTTNAGGTVDLRIVGAGFSVSPSSLDASATNSQAGADITLRCRPSSLGDVSGSLTVIAGETRATLTLKARAVAGLPAGPADEISDDAFDAVWTFIGDADAQGNYTLDVRESGASISGFPRKVPAASGRFRVDNLIAETDYTYTVASITKTSEPVAVRTTSPIQLIDFLFDGDLFLISSPGVPSEPAELLMEVENIDSDITVTVGEPFELSADLSEWKRTLVLSPDDDHLYIRLNATRDGLFAANLTATAGSYVNDNIVIEGRATSTPAFVEDFETTPAGSYDRKNYQGDACLWLMEDCGVWDSDPAFSGGRAARFGKNGNGLLEMLEDKTNGAGIVTFHAHTWRNDGDAEVAVEFSTDGGATFNKAGTVKIEGEEYKAYTVYIRSTAPTRIRLRQTAGERFMVDVLSISDYTTGVDDILAERHTWAAYASGSVLTVEVSANEALNGAIYGVDGITYFNGEFTPGVNTFDSLPAGVYIVTAGDFARRVVIR